MNSMQKQSKTNLDAVQLDVRDGEGQVVVTQENEDRFVRTCQWAVEACKLGMSRDLWLHEFHSLLERVRLWAQENASLIRAC